MSCLGFLPSFSSSPVLLASSPPIDRRGYLCMQGFFGWHRYWCVLEPARLLLYTNNGDASPYTTIELKECRAVRGGEGRIVVVYSNHSVYKLQADTDAMKEQWIRRLNRAIVMLRQKPDDYHWCDEINDHSPIIRARGSLSRASGIPEARTSLDAESINFIEDYLGSSLCSSTSTSPTHSRSSSPPRSPRSPRSVSSRSSMTDSFEPESSITPICLTIKYEDLKQGRLIGHGSFGQVYLATWRGTQVAVKKPYIDQEEEDDDPTSTTALASTYSTIATAPQDSFSSSSSSSSSSSASASTNTNNNSNNNSNNNGNHSSSNNNNNNNNGNQANHRVTNTATNTTAPGGKAGGPAATNNNANNNNANANNANANANTANNNNNNNNAQQQQHGKPHALEKAMQDFRLEIDVLCRLRHPNIVQFIGVCESPLAIITEYVQRGSLFKLLHSKKVRMEWNKRLSLARDAARGMLYLHSYTPCIVHRDLNTINLLVTKGWECKVCDFGLSRLKPNTWVTTGSGGTPNWMAPEVLKSEPFDEKADVYSFGVVLWELATGEIPWAGMHPLQIVTAVALQGRKLPTPASCPAAYSNLVQRCMNFDATQRPGFEEILNILDSVQSPQDNIEEES